MGRVDLREDLKSLSEFRANAAAVIAQVRRTKRPVVLTQHGRSAAVLLDVDEYEALLERVELLQDVQTAERQLAAGQGIAHEDAEACTFTSARVRIVWSPLALERVDEAAEYVARDRPEAARRWVHSLFEAVSRLERLPESGRPVPELPHRPELREVIHGAYRVIYRVESNRVSVLTVRHGRRLLDPSELGEGE